MALGSRMALGSTGAPSPQVQLTQEGTNSINWICQSLGAALTSLRSLAQALSAQKAADLCVLLCKSSQASWEEKGQEKGEINTMLYLILCLLPPPLSCPPTSHPFKRTFVLQNVVVLGACRVTGPAWGGLWGCALCL